MAGRKRKRKVRAAGGSASPARARSPAARPKRSWLPFAVGAAIVLGGLLAWLGTRARDGAGSRALAVAAPPNVLLVSIDTLRADHLGLYGARVPTPTLDRLGAEGVVFDWAVSHVPITLPSHASLLTGQYPIAHGVRDNGSFRLDDERTTLAEVLAGAGYRTAAFVGSFALDSRFGLAQGFELYDDYYGDSSAMNDFAISERRAEEVLAPALAWIGDRRAGEHWFAFVHLYDPHAPYVPPEPYRTELAADPYTGEVLYVDGALGAFFDELAAKGRLENTLVVVTADHGEGLGEHGEKTHGMFAYETTLHVPLLFWWKNVLPAGRRVAPRVRLIDVAPTVAELAGVALPGEQGASLVPFLAPGGGAPEEDRESYFEALAFNLNRNWAPLTGLYRDRYKYIALPIPELYDLAADPREERNLYEAHPGRARQLAEALERLVETSSTPESRAIRHAEIDAETVARLETLGYTVAPVARKEPSEYTEADDPKRLVHLSDKLDAGVAAHLAGRPDEAVRLFREILAERPTFANAYSNLAYVLAETGRLGEAIAVLEDAVRRGLANRTMLARLGSYLQEAGRVDEAIALLEAVVDENPTYAEAFNYLGVAYAAAGRVDDALAALDRVVALDPSYASAYNNRGSVLLAAGRLAEAERAFSEALEIDPRLAGAWNGLGVVYARTGRDEKAIDAWKRAVELDPREFDTLYNLGTLLTKKNRFGEAVTYLERFAETAPPARYGADLPKVRRLVAELKARIRS